MEFLSGYIETISNLPRIIAEKEAVALNAAAEKLAWAYKQGKLIHIIGTGPHDSMAAEEFFMRPGSLMNINPMFDPSLSVTHSAWRSFMIEPLEGYAEALKDYYHISAGDVAIIVSAYGVNTITIEMAEQLKNANACVIAITSKGFSKKVDDNAPCRHISKKNLCDLESVDLYINSHIPWGDTIVEIEGVEQTFGPVSSIANSIVLGMLNALAIKKLLEVNVLPDIVLSPYSDKSNYERNEVNFKKYYKLIKHI